MFNRNIIRQRALEKLDELLKSALQNYEATHDVSELHVNAEQGIFSEVEYEEIKDHLESINLVPRDFISSCIYRGLDVPKELIPIKL